MNTWVGQHLLHNTGVLIEVNLAAENCATNKITKKTNKQLAEYLINIYKQHTKGSSYPISHPQVYIYFFTTYVSLVYIYTSFHKSVRYESGAIKSFLVGFNQSCTQLSWLQFTGVSITQLSTEVDP